MELDGCNGVRGQHLQHGLSRLQIASRIASNVEYQGIRRLLVHDLQNAAKLVDNFVGPTWSTFETEDADVAEFRFGPAIVEQDRGVEHGSAWNAKRVLELEDFGKFRNAIEICGSKRLGGR